MTGTITKIAAASARRSDSGQVSLAAGERVALRMWDAEPPRADKPMHTNDYETVGYAVAGRAELTIGDATVTLEPGDSWLVPAGAEHRYTIVEPFTAIEATAPPAR